MSVVSVSVVSVKRRAADEAGCGGVARREVERGCAAWKVDYDFHRGSRAKTRGLGHVVHGLVSGYGTRRRR